MAQKHIKVLVVEDSPVVRDLLVHVLRSDPQLEVVGTAADGAEALALLERSTPDVVTMDVNMPKMNGFEVTRRIMETQPVPVVIVSASWKPNEVATTFHAVEAGAVAVVGKPHGPGHPQHAGDAQNLVQTVKAMSEVKVVRRWRRNKPPDKLQEKAPEKHPARLPERPPEAARKTHDVQVVAIGSSTGGPLVLQTILARLTGNFPVPVLIVQHIAAGFFQGLADWLTQTTRLPVHIAANGELLLPGRVYLGPDNVHMGVERGARGGPGRISFGHGPPDNGFRPSVSHLFASVAKAYGPAAVGVLLTGMGRDGADELKLMRDAGAVTIAQDKESSVVHGMPGEAIRIGAASHVLNPERAADLLVGLCITGRR